MKNIFSIRLLRHATLLLRIGNVTILIDPMLSTKGGLDPVQNCGNDQRIPMVDLPIGQEELNLLLEEVDAVIVSHLHRDHWDIPAQQLLNKNKQIFCQPSDEETIRLQGFLQVQPIEKQILWKGISIHRTNGQHGTGDIGLKMGKVSGFVFKYENQTIYLAGDTIWCTEVQEALKNYQPEIIILNAGGAQFLTGDPITMTTEDVLKVHDLMPNSKIIAVHMDTVNHCFSTRSDLRKVLVDKKLTANILIPEDGEIVKTA